MISRDREYNANILLFGAARDKQYTVSQFIFCNNLRLSKDLKFSIADKSKLASIAFLKKLRSLNFRLLPLIIIKQGKRDY